MSGSPDRSRWRRVTPADGLLVLALAVGSLAMFTPWAGTGGGAREVDVVSRGQVAAVVPLTRTGTHRIAGILGESVFEIRDGGVVMRSSPCPDGLCVRQGLRSRAGDAVVCVPNGVALILRGRGDVDVVAH